MADNVFYVYVLFRPDGRPCYIGKGKGNRWNHHERYESKNPHLKRIIRKAGGELPKAKLYEDLNEERAFELEVELICYIGREKNGGPLVNLTDGGEGVAGGENHWDGLSHPEVAKAIRLALKNKPKSESAKMAMSKAAKKRDRSAGYSDKHADAIRKGVTAFWDKRRQMNGGKPPSLRGKSGNKKHSAAMRAHYAAIRASQAPTATAV